MKVAPLLLVCILPKYDILQAKFITDIKVISGCTLFTQPSKHFYNMQLIGKLELGVLTVVPW